MLTLGLKAGGPPAVQTKAPRSCCLERLCWEGAVLCSALEGSLEFPNRMRLFDRKPSPLHLLGQVKPSRRIISPSAFAAPTHLFPNLLSYLSPPPIPTNSTTLLATPDSPAPLLPQPTPELPE